MTVPLKLDDIVTRPRHIDDLCVLYDNAGSGRVVKHSDLAERGIDLVDNGWARIWKDGEHVVLPAYTNKAATEAEKKAQEDRAEKWDIGIKAGGNVTKPSEWSDLSDDDFADPVNYKGPIHDKTHADNAASRWGDHSDGSWWSTYTADERAIISDRIEAAQKKFGEKSEEKQTKDALPSADQPETPPATSDALPPPIATDTPVVMTWPDQATRVQQTGIGAKESGNVDPPAGFEAYAANMYNWADWTNFELPLISHESVSAARIKWGKDMAEGYTLDEQRIVGWAIQMGVKMFPGVASPEPATKDWLDDLLWGGSWDCSFTSQMRSLCGAFCDVVEGLDALADAQEQNGIIVDIDMLVDELAAALRACYAASGEDDEFTKSKIKSAVMSVRKAGKRHSKQDENDLRQAHDHIMTARAHIISVFPALGNQTVDPDGDGDVDNTGTGADVDESNPTATKDAEPSETAEPVDTPPSRTTQQLIQEALAAELPKAVKAALADSQSALTSAQESGGTQNPDQPAADQGSGSDTTPTTVPADPATNPTGGTGDPPTPPDQNPAPVPAVKSTEPGAEEPPNAPNAEPADPLEVARHQTKQATDRAVADRRRNIPPSHMTTQQYLEASNNERLRHRNRR